jgi:hydroxypyruvate reductase|tara:strand:- start:1563 stop:2831 length:1269 start_codon:yes stop_codon:yes gene_type:complete
VSVDNPQAALRGLFDAAVAAADPALTVPPHLPAPPAGRAVVVGAGKASAAMARAVEDNWDGDLAGLVVTSYGCAVPCDRIEIVEAAHPVPDAAGLEAAERILGLAKDLSADDLLLALISGGGSALLTLPAAGLSLEDKQTVNSALLRSGATIGDMNCVRKHLSAIKGGRLAAAASPAGIVSLLISDVPGDDPAVIASGPTVADHTTTEDALGVIEKFAIDVPPAVADYLRSDAAETPKPGDPAFEATDTRIVARPQDSLDAAASKAEEMGWTAVILGDAIEGEARDVAREHATLALGAMETGKPAKPPAVLLSGGEVTVTLKGKGRGGPNTEYLLALAEALDGAAGIHALACDTDGIDGSEDNAGAVIGPETLARARGQGLDAAKYLADNDAYGFFEALGDLVVSGPTLTNVNDFRAILLTP